MVQLNVEAQDLLDMKKFDLKIWSILWLNNEQYKTIFWCDWN